MENSPNFWLQPTHSTTSINSSIVTNHSTPTIEAQAVMSDANVGPNGDNETEFDGSSTWYRPHWQKSEDR